MMVKTICFLLKPYYQAGGQSKFILKSKGKREHTHPDYKFTIILIIIGASDFVSKWLTDSLDNRGVQKKKSTN